MTAPAAVSIDVDELELAGHLRVPDAHGDQPHPALVFTGVNEQVTGLYADRLAAAGYITLAFDHRNYGGSEGRNRGHEDAAGKLEDLQAATSYLANRDDVDVDRIGCVGICMGGGYALRHSAFDRRIRALAVVAAAFNDPRAMQSGIGREGYQGMMAGDDGRLQPDRNRGGCDRRDPRRPCCRCRVGVDGRPPLRTPASDGGEPSHRAAVGY